MLFAAPAWNEGMTKKQDPQEARISPYPPLRCIEHKLWLQSNLPLAALVLAGTSPVDLLVTERTDMYKELKCFHLVGKERENEGGKEEKREFLVGRHKDRKMHQQN